MAADTSDPQSWFLRIAGGTVFGPVAIKGLIVWAEQGRVAPGNEISTDRKDWRPAESLPELEMTWYLEEPAGSLAGPFHRLAAEALIRDGRAAAGSRLVAAADADLSRLRRPAEARHANGVNDGQLELELAAEARPGGDNHEEAPPAWRDERDTLLLRIAELEEQARQLQRQSEKENRSHARQQDNWRKQAAQLERELEDLRQNAAQSAANDNVAPTEKAASESAATLQEALDLSRRETADALQLAEREAGELRARIAELETQAAEAGELRARIAELEAQVAEAANVNAQLTEIGDHNVSLEAALGEARSAYAELLSFSNTRDAEATAQLHASGEQLTAAQAERDAALAKLSQHEAQATAAHDPAMMREAAARVREYETLMAGLLEEESKALDQALAAEHESFARLRDGSLRLQNLLQTRLAAIRKLQGGDTADVIERQAQRRASKADSERARDSLETLRQQHTLYIRQAEERERELAGRVRLLESEADRLKSRLADSDGVHQRLQDMAATLRERELELSQERQRRSIEHEQLESAQQTLLQRLEMLESAGDKLPLSEQAAENSSKGRGAFRATPWMRLKR